MEREKKGDRTEPFHIEMKTSSNKYNREDIFSIKIHVGQTKVQNRRKKII